MGISDWSSDVCSSDLTFAGGRRESGEVGYIVGADLSVADERVNLTDGGSGGTVDADPSQLAGRLGDLVGCFTDQRQRHAPLIKPSEIGDEAGRQFEPERAIDVAGGDSGACS